MLAHRSSATFCGMRLSSANTASRDSRSPTRGRSRRNPNQQMLQIVSLPTSGRYAGGKWTGHAERQGVPCQLATDMSSWLASARYLPGQQIPCSNCTPSLVLSRFLFDLGVYASGGLDGCEATAPIPSPGVSVTVKLAILLTQFLP